MFEIALIIALLSVCIIYVSDAVMDKLQFHWNRTIFYIHPSRYNPKFWNPEISWKNKWDEDTLKPKFWGSTTIFVFLTDAWHLFKFIRNIAIVMFGISMAMVEFYYKLYLNIYVFILIYSLVLRLIGGGVFTLFFDKLLEYHDIYGIKGKDNTPSNERNSDWNDKVNGLK